MSSDESNRVSKEEFYRRLIKNRKREGWQKEGNEYDAYRPGTLVSKKAKKEKKKHKHKHSKKSHKSDSNEESSHSKEEC